MKSSFTHQFRHKHLALSVVAALGAFTSIQGFAQDAALEEVRVTGTRIRQTSGMITPTPVTAITIGELADFRPDSTLAEQLDQLPQFFQTQSAQRGGVISGTGGGSNVNMRGIGGNRTLVLLDGSRVVPNDRTNVVNVDVLPTALVSNIEVVTGGASAAYGADALAGVVNFVLDREFEGLKISSSTGITEQHDGQNWSASIAGGRQFGDRLHLIGSLEGRRVHQIDRDMSAASGQWDSFQRWGHVTNPAWSTWRAANPTAPLSQSPVPQRLTLPYVHSTAHTPTGLITAAGSALNRQTFARDGKSTRPFVLGEVASVSGVGSTQSQSGGPEAGIADLSFNAGPFGNEVQQEALFTGIKFDATDRLAFTGDVIISNTESNTYNQLGIPHLTTPWQATIYRDNPFLPEAVRDVMIRENRASITLEKLGQPMGIKDYDSNESQHSRFAMWTGNAGFEFDINDNFRLTGHYQSGETDRDILIYNEVRIDRLFLALDAVRNPTTGAIQCNVQVVNPTDAQLAAAVAGQTFAGQQPKPITRTSPIGMDNSIRDCVPLNVFGVGNASDAAIDYVTDNRISHSVVEQDFAELVLDGEIWEGFGAGPWSMAAGLTWRESSFNQYYETESGDPLDGPARNAPTLGIRGIPAGYSDQSTSMYMFGGVPVISGEYDVTELFAELNVPLFDNGTQQLDSSFAARSSDYSRSGKITAWKTGLSFQALESLRFRGTLSHDVREPSFSELFDQQGTAGTVNDGNFGTYQITMLQGGNPSLSPEEADTTTVGVVWQPGGMLDGLQMSVDWYELDIEGLVGAPGVQRIRDDCAAGATEQCQYITRDAASGRINVVRNVFQNINAAKVSGVDIEVAYSFEPDFIASEAETFSLRALAGYLGENSQTNIGAAKFEQAGGPGRPEWTTTITGTYTVGPWNAMLRANYYDSVLLNASWIEGIDVDDNTTASNTVFNAGVGYSGEMSSGSSWRVSANVINLFDREPPIVPSFSSRFGTQTVSNDYDVFGRRYQLSFNYDF
jgi:iron complex outermembrane receptor protein